MPNRNSMRNSSAIGFLIRRETDMAMISACGGYTWSSYASGRMKQVRQASRLRGWYSQATNNSRLQEWIAYTVDRRSVENYIAPSPPLPSPRSPPRLPPFPRHDVPVVSARHCRIFGHEMQFDFGLSRVRRRTNS